MIESDGMNDINNRTIIRYYVAPAVTIRGWLIKRVLLVNGRETGDNWRERCTTKAEAKTRKERLNRALGARFIPVSVDTSAR